MPQHVFRRVSLFVLVAGLVAVLAACATPGPAGCDTVERWVARAQPWSLGQDFNRMQSQGVRQRVAPLFHDDVMRAAWGTSYRELSDSRRADIHAALARCPTQPWVRTVLSTPFTNPPELVRRSPTSDYAQWQLAIDAINRTPLAELERRQQQLTAAADQAAQRRAEAAARAPERAQLAQEIAAARRQQAEARAQKAAQEAAARNAQVQRYRDAGPFSGNDGMAYLNALVKNDREALRSYDRMFAAGLGEVADMYKGSGTEALIRLFQGPAAAARVGEVQRKVFENYSLVIPVAVAYIVYYEHAYPGCMDRDARSFERTVQYEWVSKNAMGQVLKTSPAWTERQVIRINPRFMPVWNNKGSVEHGNTIFLDTVFGRAGAIRVSDAMSAATGAMHQFACDSETMQQLEKNLLAYFQDSLQRIQNAAN